MSHRGKGWDMPTTNPTQPLPLPSVMLMGSCAGLLLCCHSLLCPVLQVVFCLSWEGTMPSLVSGRRDSRPSRNLPQLNY